MTMQLDMTDDDGDDAPSCRPESPSVMDASVRPSRKTYRHKQVPRKLDLKKRYESTSAEEPPTTLMIRNVPNRFKQQDLIAELEGLGFAGSFDFVYLPVDQGNRHRHHGLRTSTSSVGYGFVNFVDHTWAEMCMAVMQGHCFQRHGTDASGRCAVISVAHLQGLEANLAHYENSAVNNAKLRQHAPAVMRSVTPPAVMRCFAPPGLAEEPWAEEVDARSVEAGSRLVLQPPLLPPWAGEIWDLASTAPVPCGLPPGLPTPWPPVALAAPWLWGVPPGLGSWLPSPEHTAWEDAWDLAEMDAAAVVVETSARTRHSGTGRGQKRAGTEARRPLAFTGGA
mmetsp:Transcript_41214/g.87788  ORF Transcript_41214/g.87788 Transcript_41214/m.87788 type:complete len:338 (-) Transcript_41214:51-1064(-)